MRISWTEKKSNEKVMEMAEYERSLLKIIRLKNYYNFGHVNRAEGLANIGWKDFWSQKQRKTTHKTHK